MNAHWNEVIPDARDGAVGVTRTGGTKEGRWSFISRGILKHQRQSKAFYHNCDITRVHNSRSRDKKARADRYERVGFIISNVSRRASQDYRRVATLADTYHKRFID